MLTTFKFRVIALYTAAELTIEVQEEFAGELTYDTAWHRAKDRLSWLVANPLDWRFDENSR